MAHGRLTRLFAVAAPLLLAASAAARTPAWRRLTIPHQRFRLANGLQVILHPARRSAKVVVNVRYRVGSANEPRRRTGVAHLFEHLMFMGTKRVPEKQIDLLMERAGGWNNAYTGEDATVYYDVGPPGLLPTLLWIEADRMGTLATALTPAKLALQRKVVLNERRQSYENAPYGVVGLKLPALLFPRGHPYNWPVIGAVRDLRAVTVADLKRLFARFYSPRNASLVVAGAFDPARARRLVRRFFGWIPAGPAPTVPRSPSPRFRAARRVFRDRVELPRLILAHRSPAAYASGDAELDLAAAILARGKQSRLHRELVYRRRLAVGVSATQESRRLPESSVFSIAVTTRAGASRAQIEQAVERVLRGLLAAPPTAAELQRARAALTTGFVVSLQRVQNRADLLNRYLHLTGRSDFLVTDLRRYAAATAASVQRVLRRVLRRERRVTVWVVPHGGRRGRVR